MRRPDGPVFIQFGETINYDSCGWTEEDDDDDDDDNETLVYVKESQKPEWLKNMLESEARDDTIIEKLDTDYEDVESLKNLDDINI